MGIAVNSTKIFLARLANLLGSVATSVILARLLGPTGKGELVAIFLIPMFMGKFLAFYMHGSVTYWLAKGKHDNKVVLGTAISFMLLVSVLGLIAYLLVVFLADIKIFYGVDRLHLTLAGLMVPLGLLSSIFSGALLSKEIVRPQNVISVADPVIFLIAFFALCLIGEKYLGYAVVSRFVAAGVGSVYIFSMAARHFNIRLHLNLEVLWSLFRYGVFGHLSMILGFVVYRIDMFFIWAIAGKTQLGLYSMSVTMAELLWLAPGAIAYLIFPRVAGTSPESSARTTAQGCRHSLLLAVGGALIYVIVGKWMISGLFGRDFTGAYIPLVLLLPGICANAMGKSTAAYLAGIGRVEILLGISVICCIANILLNIALIPRYGIGGAAMATTLSYILAFSLSAWAFVRCTGLKIWNIIIPTLSDCAQYGRLFSIWRVYRSFLSSE